MPAVSGRVLESIQQVRSVYPVAQFVIGGRGLSSRLRSQTGVRICQRVSEVVEAVDARIKRAELN